LYIARTQRNAAKIMYYCGDTLSVLVLTKQREALVIARGGSRIVATAAVDVAYSGGQND
jgi:hypothetical protein